MGNKSKTFGLVFILIMAISSLEVLVVRPANAQTAITTSSIPTPSVPEFTVKFVNTSYEIPASSTINPYTGQNETSPSSYVENYSIQVIVKNQPFTPQWIQVGSSGFTDSLYYNVRMKGHFADNWTVLYNPDLGFSSQSNSEYTTVYSEDFNPNVLTADYQIDFQVQALIGAVHRGYNPSATNQLEMYPWVFDGQTSDWSNAETLTIPANASSSTPSPTVPEFSWLAILPLSISLLSGAVILKLKHRKTSKLNQ